MTTVEFPEEIEKTIHQMTVQLGNLLAMVPTQTPEKVSDPEYMRSLSPEDMVEVTAMIQLDAARRALLSACASYEGATAIHRMLAPTVRPHA